MAVEVKLRAGAMGKIAAIGEFAAIMTRRFVGFATGMLNIESSGAFTKRSAAQPYFSSRVTSGSTATFG